MTNNSVETKEQQLKSSKTSGSMVSNGMSLKSKENMVSSTPNTRDWNINRSTVFLKMYGISKPEEEFLKGFQRTIEDQITAISLKK